MNKKRSFEEVNILLFDETENFSEGNIQSNRDEEPRLLKQKHLSLDQELEPVPYYKKPLVQATVIAVIALPVGWGLISAFSSNEPSQTKRSPTSIENSENQILKTSLSQEREKNQDLIIERGLRTQQMEVVRIEPKKTPPSPQTTVQKPVSIQHPQTTASRSVNDASVSPPPRPPIKVEPTLKTITTNPITKQASASTQPKQPTPQTTQDPMQQWLLAANTGKYGQAINSESSVVATKDTATTQQLDVETSNSQDFNWQPTGGTGTPINESDLMNAQPTSDSTYVKNVLVGSKATGKLETPIMWSSESDFNQSYLIKLTEPLLAFDKSIAIPKGAYLTARINKATEAGLVQMSVVSVITSEQGQTLEKPVPEGAIILLGKSGTQLRASQYQNRSHNDLEIALLSGLANVAGSINAPRSQTVFGSGSYSTTTTNRNPNHLAAFGQGVAQTVVQQQLRSRSQQSQQAQSNAPSFILDAGTTIQIFVNQSLQL
ncbi:TrbI/VirB10 family protein [Gloeocapsa sp. BRSZ]